MTRGELSSGSRELTLAAVAAGVFVFPATFAVGGGGSQVRRARLARARWCVGCTGAPAGGSFRQHYSFTVYRLPFIRMPLTFDCGLPHLEALVVGA